MSDNIPNRVYQLGKAYLNKVRDRVDAELSDAERELQAEADRPVPGSGARPARDDASPDAAFTRAQQKIRAAQARIDAHGESNAELTAEASSKGGTANQNAAVTAPDPNASDFRILGIAPDAGWDDVLGAYEKITRRCDPRRFPDGSAEQKEAGRILERVNTAYDNLRKRLDPTESRFARLEFDTTTNPAGSPAADTPAAAPNVPPELN